MRIILGLPNRSKLSNKLESKEGGAKLVAAEPVPMHKRIRSYIDAKGLILNRVADRSGINRKRFYHLMSGYVPIRAEDFEAICTKGLEVEPNIFFEN